MASDIESRVMSLTRRYGFKPTRVLVRGTLATILFENQKGEASRYISQLKPAMKEMGVPENSMKAREISHPAEAGLPAEHVGVVEIDFSRMLERASRPGEKDMMASENEVRLQLKGGRSIKIVRTETPTGGMWSIPEMPEIAAHQNISVIRDRLRGKGLIASRPGQSERFAAFNVEFDDKDTQAIIASGQAILRNIRTTGYAPADAVVAKIRSATTDAIAALKAGKMVSYSVNGKPMGTRRKNLNSGEVAALRARIVAAINVNQLNSFADETEKIAAKDFVARGQPENAPRSRLYEIYDVAWKNWYYANELMSKGPNNTILVDRPVSRGFSRSGAKATFKVEDRFYFGK